MYKQMPVGFYKEELAYIKKKSKKLGVSFAEVVRRAVRKEMEKGKK